jgi:hypothetical protein
MAKDDDDKVVGGDGLVDGEVTYGEDIKGNSTLDADVGDVDTETNEEVKAEEHSEEQPEEPETPAEDAPEAPAEPETPGEVSDAVAEDAAAEDKPAE